jgi:hypothetical protein
MSDSEIPPQPEPKEDAPPDEGPGGPADVFTHDQDDQPPATPDQPRSAQVDEESVPDEIEEPEDVDTDVDEGEKGIDEATDEPA